MFFSRPDAEPEKCQNCDEVATHKFTRIVGGKVRELYFCNNHAQQAGSHSPKPENVQSMINAMLKSLLNKSIEIEGGAPELVVRTSANDGIVCPNCGVAFGEYRRTLLLGCSDCYTSFQELLKPDLKKYHGAVSHAGRRPGEKPPARENRLYALVELRKRMEQSITREDYSEAARLRDEIRHLESQN